MPGLGVLPSRTRNKREKNSKNIKRLTLPNVFLFKKKCKIMAKSRNALKLNWPHFFSRSTCNLDEFNNPTIEISQRRA